MAGKKSFGVVVTIDATAIGGLTNASNSGGDVSFIDTTSHDSSGGWREFVGGLIDGGTFDLEGNYDLADAGQLALISDIGESVAVVMTFSDGSTATCNAIVGKYDVANELDGLIQFTCPLKVSGPIVRAAGA